MAAKTVRNR